MDALEMTLLFDYYGDLLTERQSLCFDMRYNQDLSLAEIAEELNISRQGVHDNLSRAEALLRNMEEKTGCVSRDLACRKAAKTILDAAAKLKDHPDAAVSGLAEQIISAAQGLEE
ncbi:MAG: YlxM family DNA-binding protein [Oscillospiraceae bacterium]|nr:YlxM family DNA-binding protein [Oscillospiraceae bacterium]